MDKFFKYLPDIIEKAAAKPLGLFALMVIALSVLGFFFFREASEGTRIGIYVLLFAGVVLFGFAALKKEDYDLQNMVRQAVRESQESIDNLPPAKIDNLPPAKTTELGLQVENLENLKTAEAELTSNKAQTPTIQRKEMPKWLPIALGELGNREIEGKEHSERILEYIRSARGFESQGDRLPWTSFFVNWVLKQVEIEGTNRGLAPSWLNWGNELEVPKLGCIVVGKIRHPSSGAGFVGFFLVETDTRVLMVVGNVRDAVRVAAFPKALILGYRWPKDRNT